MVTSGAVSPTRGWPFAEIRFCKRPVWHIAVRNADIDLSSPQISKFDLAFFRNTGVILVCATISAGAITLFLTYSDSPIPLIAKDAELKIGLEVAAASKGDSSKQSSLEGSRQK